jgi:hypothetical protein
MEASALPTPLEEQVANISRKCEGALLELFNIWLDPQKETVNIYFAAFRNAFTVSSKQFHEASQDDLKEWLVAYLQWGFESDLKEEYEEGITVFGGGDKEESDLDET